MPRDSNWQGTDTVLRAELKMARALGDQLNLRGEIWRRALHLTDRQWRAWTDFLVEGPLPAEPSPPEMLRRLGEVAFNLSRRAERLDRAAG
jgi:hypothetical protein